MDLYEMLKIRESARDKIVISLQDILNATEFGSGFTDAEILAQIRKQKKELRKLLAIAQGK